MHFKLTLEPVPEKSWGISLAHILPPKVWDVVRREIYSSAGRKCEICGYEDRRLHCHEEWQYKEGKRRTQTLVRLRCLCEYCHDVKHWGHTTTMVHKGERPNNYLDILEKHFCEVNECSKESFLKYRVEMGELGHYRSKYKYLISFGKFEPGKIIKVWSKIRK